ncbi:MAG: hypothetical protein KGL53_05940, partial [Elusimicrobia bacterium]|nr:hypothetical protein [Elusimicrobiota bacterium]
MRLAAAFLIAAFCARPARADNSAQVQVLIAVQTASQQLQQADAQRQQAIQSKNQDAQTAINAKIKWDNTPYGVFGIRKGQAQSDFLQANAAYNEAVGRANDATDNYAHVGQGYLAAESSYRDVNGHFYDPQQVDLVRQQIGVVLQQQQQQNDPNAPADQAQNVQQMLNAGQISTPGQLAQAGTVLSQAGDQLIMNSLKMGAPGAKPPSASDAAGLSGPAAAGGFSGGPGAPGGASF